jgi:hypothetical protein
VEEQKMSKKNYELIARVLSDLRADAADKGAPASAYNVLDIVAAAFAREFELQNPKFKPVLFLRKSGYGKKGL